MKALVTCLAVLLGSTALAANDSPALVAPLAARARVERPMSVLGGWTLGKGNTLLFVQAGYPGVSAALLRGLSETSDVGLRLDFDYQLENMTEVSEPELKLQLVYRLSLVRQAKFQLALELDPGFALYFGNTTRMGPTLPVRLQASIPLGKTLALHFGVDTGITVFFHGYKSFHVPVLLGGGLAWGLSRKIALTLDVKAGPVISHYGFPVIGETDTGLGLEASLGLGWSL